MDREHDKGDAEKAKRPMKEAVGKVIDDRKKELVGTKDAEEKVAADLNDAAQKDTKKG
jgi:uncharacterized protein YjbJ (UPF0337 family)